MRLDRIAAAGRRLVVGVWLLWVLAGCGSGGGPSATGQLRAWADGPAGWLLLPEERRRARRVVSVAEALNLIEEFWRRRDPDPAVPGNPVREAFQQRVEAADQLYGEADRRGSLSDRGGALILLGSPSHLHVTSRPALRWDLSENRPERVASEEQSYEIWGYRLEDLPPRLVELLSSRGDAEAVVLQLSFARGRGRTRLAEGRELLDLAARALAGEP